MEQSKESQSAEDPRHYVLEARVTPRRFGVLGLLLSNFFSRRVRVPRRHRKTTGGRRREIGCIYFYLFLIMKTRSRPVADGPQDEEDASSCAPRSSERIACSTGVDGVGVDSAEEAFSERAGAAGSQGRPCFSGPAETYLVSLFPSSSFSSPFFF